jgi:muramoyltetrapeptide carboxypeptidase LdcA involved in peptidoglycan recycling
VKPPRLRRGDVVGVVSPSWGGAGAFPHRVEKGIAQLEALGFRVALARHARGQHGAVSDSAEHRVQDLHDMFRDPEVRLVLAAIGGDHSCHLLPRLDFELIRRHPKAFMGYSDITVLNLAIWRETGLVTFNGPALLTDFAEHPRMLPYTEQWWLRALCSAEPIGALEPAPAWTEEILEWRTQRDLERPRRLTPSPGWSWLRGGVAEGPLVGGCLESLQHLRGTRFWPDWDGALFFFETSEEKPSPAKVDGILMDYEVMGVLARIRGLLVGRPMHYTDEEKRALHAVLLERTQAHGFPLVADVDFGHTAPQLTLPIGCRARLDADARRLEILEAAVE